MKKQNTIVNILLTVYLGFFRAHKFYQKKYKQGFLYFFTVGLLGIGWIVDIFLLFRTSPKKQTIKVYTKPSLVRGVIKVEYPEEVEEKSSKVNYFVYEKYFGLPTDFVVLDFETTGLSYQFDKIIQIGAVRYKKFEIIDEFETLINPDIHIPDHITEKTGITNEDVKYAPKIDEVLFDLIDFLEDDIILAYNAPYDMKFLLQNMMDCNIPHKIFKVIDVLPLARKRIESPNHKLETIKNLLGLNEFGSHQSLDDCFVTAKVYQHCYNSFFNYDGIVLDIYNKVKSILESYDLRTDFLKIDITSSNYVKVLYVSEILRFKNGKNFYLLDNRPIDQLSHLQFKMEIGTKTEFEKTRVYLTSAEDLHFFEDIIIEKYHSANENIEVLKEYSPKALREYFI